MQLSYFADGSVNWSSPFGKLLANLLNLNVFILWPRSPTPGPKSTKNIYNNGHNIIIYNSQQLKTTQIL